MHRIIRWLSAGVIAGVGVALARHDAVADLRKATPPCATDSSYQRLAFWIGDWSVFDSLGTRYASQRVQSIIDQCAITAEWTGPIGDRGMSLTAYDPRTHDWKQVYASNQVPGPAGVSIRKSDPSYDGPGVRFVPMADPAPGETSRLRITVLPLPDHRANELFEESHDGGTTWQILFKAEHRPRAQ
jgi:hypothetical protein